MACSCSCLVRFSRALLGTVQEHLLCYIFHSGFQITGTPTTHRPAKSATPKISLEYLCVPPTYFAPGVLTPPQLEFPLALQAVVQRETPRSHSELLQLEIPLEIRPVVPREALPSPPGRPAWPEFESLGELRLVMLCEPPPGRFG